MSTGQAPQLCWERIFPGRNPRQVHLSEGCLAFDYIDDQGAGGAYGPSTTVCMDFDGNELWKAPRIRLECPLAGNRFVAVTDSGEPCVVHAKDGQVENCGKELGISGPTRVWRQGEHVFILEGNELLIADVRLRPMRRVSLTTNRGAIFAHGHVYIESGTIMFSDFDRAQVLCPIPVDLAEAAMVRWESETETPAIGGMLIDGSFDPSTIVAAIRDPQKQRAVPMGYRSGYRWLLQVEPQAGVVFLANGDPPHLLACVGLDGRPRWCVYLSGACCGGLPHLLANGRYVVSSGCGGTLSWIDGDGHLVAQSKPQEGVGLARALSNRIVGLLDSGCLVSGEPGIIAFGPQGHVRWIWKHAAPSSIALLRETGSWRSPGARGRTTQRSFQSPARGVGLECLGVLKAALSALVHGLW